jgi:hypothetical protein
MLADAVSSNAYQARTTAYCTCYHEQYACRRNFGACLARFVAYSSTICQIFEPLVYSL